MLCVTSKLLVIISISLKSYQHFTEPNEKKGAKGKEELTFLLLLMCTINQGSRSSYVIGCNLFLKILTSLLVVECGYGYFGWCFWLKLSVFVCMLPIRWRQLRVPRSIHSCIIGYNICQSLCSSIKRHLLDPLLSPTYNQWPLHILRWYSWWKNLLPITYLGYLKGQFKILFFHIFLQK